MRVLVVYDSNGAGRGGPARALGQVLAGAGICADLSAADDVDDLDPYDAVVMEGARDAGRFHPFARRFARRHASGLRNLPILFISGGPPGQAAVRGETGPAPLSN